MPPPSSDAPHVRAQADRGADAAAPRAVLLRRGAGFLALWVCLIGFSPLDLAVGVPAAAIAAWSSLRLWPSGAGCASTSIPRYAARFLWQSIIAGLEVARIAFAREIDLKPGFTTYRTALPPGMRREALCTLMSLQPGKMPVGITADGEICIHCLNMRHAAASELCEDEAEFLKVLKPEPSHV
jgi:multicomponent Na+:H+ antiporter subunit E